MSKNKVKHIKNTAPCISDRLCTKEAAGQDRKFISQAMAVLTAVMIIAAAPEIMSRTGYAEASAQSVEYASELSEEASVDGISGADVQLHLPTYIDVRAMAFAVPAIAPARAPVYPAPEALGAQTSVTDCARQYIGVKYTPAGVSPETGFDCSGFVYFVYNQCGISVPYRSCQAFYDRCTVISEAELQPGDLIFFKNTFRTDQVSHVGIYSGGGKMIHAGSGGICEVSINTEYWKSHFYAYGRYVKN